jgi:hypothetical protein
MAASELCADENVEMRLPPLKWATDNGAMVAMAAWNYVGRNVVMPAMPNPSLAGDVEALGLMLGLSAEIDTAIGQAVTGLRAFGYSWAEIGSRLGITRQAAQQPWGQAS